MSLKALVVAAVQLPSDQKKKKKKVVRSRGGGGVEVETTHGAVRWRLCEHSGMEVEAKRE